MNRSTLNYVGVMLSIAMLFPAAIHTVAGADDDAAKSDEVAEKDDKDSKKPESVDELLAKCDKVEGLWTLLKDRETGERFILVKQEQLGEEFIHWVYIENGVPELGHFRGNFQGSRIFTIERDHQNLRFAFEPVRYYFSPAHPLSRSSNANVSRAVFASVAIKAIDEQKGWFVVPAKPIFLDETIHQIRPSDRPNQKDGEHLKLGKLSKDKTRFKQTRNYPKNTDFVVEYVYDNPAPKRYADPGIGVTDTRFVTVKVQHSVINVPKNDYKPRRDDERVGYFMQQFDDMTSTDAVPYRDVINRWHLKKKDPKAKLSEPVEPIVWWMENSTPHEFRDVIRDSVEAWNVAFEQAGFKNAVQVRMQPDDADWDAGDIRYNVLRWTNSPDPQFGGYGPSFVNPRTGQILGADIMLEWIFVTNRVRYQTLFGPDETASKQAWWQRNPAQCTCTFSTHLHDSTMLGRVALAAQDAPKVEVQRLLKESLYYLMLHEVGHTLGLNHNFRASQLHPLKDIHNRKLTETVGLNGSVMDYPALNLASDTKKQGQFYPTIPGPYDRWAIEYGYSTALGDPAAESNRLNAILNRSIEPQHAFGNDADDMRYPGRGIDPRIMIGDISSDGLTWSDQQMDRLKRTLQTLLDKYDRPNGTYEELRGQFLMLMRSIGYSAGVSSRYVGGVYLNRSRVGQAVTDAPYTPVPRDTQLKAMRILDKHVFAPNAWRMSSKLLSHLRYQRRGFNHYGRNEDVKVHDLVLGIQSRTLTHLLHADVLARLTDSRLYGNGYSTMDCLSDLTRIIFDTDSQTNVNTMRQNLQVEYVNRLCDILGSESKREYRTVRTRSNKGNGYDHLAKSAALHQLNRILDLIDNDASINAETRAHRAHLTFIINQALAD